MSIPPENICIGFISIVKVKKTSNSLFQHDLKICKRFEILLQVAVTISLIYYADLLRTYIFTK